MMRQVRKPISAMTLDQLNPHRCFLSLELQVDDQMINDRFRCSRFFLLEIINHDPVTSRCFCKMLSAEKPVSQLIILCSTHSHKPTVFHSCTHLNKNEGDCCLGPSFCSPPPFLCQSQGWKRRREGRSRWAKGRRWFWLQIQKFK